MSESVRDEGVQRETSEYQEVKRTLSFPRLISDMAVKYARFDWSRCMSLRARTTSAA